MINGSTWMVLAAAVFASAVGAADPRPAIAELPVADMKLVAPVEYRHAADLAARGGAALDIALRIAGAFEGSAQYIVQVNEGSEAPSASRITVVRDGLLDDAVRGERWDIALERTPAGLWGVNEVKRAWRCRRGEPLDRFATASCP
jgi:hypothetical protein